MRGKDLIQRWWRGLGPSYRWMSLIFAVFLVLILTITYFYYRVYLGSERTFWATIDNNLATASVVKKTSQTNGTAGVDSYTGLVFNGRPILHSLRQISDGSTAPNTRLTLEAIGTETTDYQRYSQIDQPSSGGKPLDFSGVYKIWLKTSSENRTSSQLSSNLFGPVLFGNLPHSQRAEIKSILRQAYKPTFVGQVYEDGRRVYKYSVKVDMKKYTQAVQRYIKITGIRAKATVPPGSVGNSAEFYATIDVDSRQLVSLNASGGGASREDFVSYGIRYDVEPPSKTYTVADLQNAIQAASQ